MKKGSVEAGLVYHAGFPNAGEDQHGTSLSLDALVIRHRASTFFWRLETEVGESQWAAGTVLVVDRALPVREGRLVVAIADEAFIVARYRRKGFYDLSGSLLPKETRFWGVITYALQEVA